MLIFTKFLSNKVRDVARQSTKLQIVMKVVNYLYVLISVGRNLSNTAACLQQRETPLGIHRKLCGMQIHT